MPLRASYIIAPLVLLASFWFHEHYPQYLWYITIIGAFILLLIVRSIWRKQFVAHWRTHLSAMVLYLSSVAQFYLFEDTGLRWLYAITLTVIWLWLVISMQTYVGRVREYSSRQLLQINQATSLLTVWQSASFAYFAVGQLHLSLWFMAALLMAAIWAVTIDIVHLHQIRKSQPSMILLACVATCLQLFFAIYLLPLHLYIQSSLLTLWYFFIIELTIEGQEVQSRRKLFISYLLFIAAAGIVLIAISLL